MASMRTESQIRERRNELLQFEVFDSFEEGRGWLEALAWVLEEEEE